MTCAACDEPLDALGAERCGRCLLSPPPFRSLRAAAPYRDTARAMLLAFKFRGADYLGPRLAEVMLARAGERAWPEGGPAEVTAVPATARAHRRRGFHPAEVLAGAVAAGLGLPFVPGRLRKIRETLRQSGLALADRRTNVRGAFETAGKPRGGVLVVDDVATSGATARECAASLSRAGAERVDVWCFARASRAALLADRILPPAAPGDDPHRQGEKPAARRLQEISRELPSRASPRPGTGSSRICGPEV